MDTVQLKLAQLDREEKAAKKAIQLGQALERLRNNKDFKALVVDGYLTNEAVRLVHLKAEPAMAGPVSQAAITRDIDAIGALSLYFQLVSRDGEKAVRDLEQIERERDYVAEEAEASKED